MTHYICKGGCKGVSDEFGFCGAEDCPSFGEVLEECECEDGKHFTGEVKDINGTVLSD